jgi:hypothetical protein
VESTKPIERKKKDKNPHENRPSPRRFNPREISKEYHISSEKSIAVHETGGVATYRIRLTEFTL